MENSFGMIINIFFVIVSITIFVGIALRISKDRFSAEKSVKAVLIDKNMFEKRVMSKAQAPYAKKKFVVVFDINGKRKSFYVSEFSYNSYIKGEKGTLTYKGSKFINFSK